MPVLDLPMPHSVGTAYRRPETVINTPYHKSNEDGRTRYGFDGGFYHSNHAHVSNPVLERQHQELRRRVEYVLAQFNQVAGVLQATNPAWEKPEPILPVIQQLITVLVEQPFGRIAMEQTPDQSLLIKADWWSMNIFIDLSFDPEFKGGHEVVLTAYRAEQRTPVLSVAGPLSYVFDRLFAA